MEVHVHTCVVVVLAWIAVCFAAPTPKNIHESEKWTDQPSPTESPDIVYVKTTSINRSTLLNESSSYDVLPTQLASTSAISTNDSSYRISSDVQEKVEEDIISNADNVTTVMMTTNSSMDIEDDKLARNDGTTNSDFHAEVPPSLTTTVTSTMSLTEAQMTTMVPMTTHKDDDKLFSNSTKSQIDLHTDVPPTVTTTVHTTTHKDVTLSSEDNDKLSSNSTMSQRELHTDVQMTTVAPMTTHKEKLSSNSTMSQTDFNTDIVPTVMTIIPMTTHKDVTSSTEDVAPTVMTMAPLTTHNDVSSSDNTDKLSSTTMMSQTDLHTDVQMTSTTVPMTTPGNAEPTTLSPMTLTQLETDQPSPTSPEIFMTTAAATNKPLIDHAINDITAKPSTTEKKPFAKAALVLTTLSPVPEGSVKNQSSTRNVTGNVENVTSSTVNMHYTTSHPVMINDTPTPLVVEWPAMKKSNYSLSGDARKTKKPSVKVKPSKNNTRIDNLIPLPTTTTTPIPTINNHLTPVMTTRWQPPLYIIVEVRISETKLCEALPLLRKFLASSISDRLSIEVSNQQVLFINTMWCGEPQNAVLVESRNPFKALAFYIVDAGKAYDRAMTNAFAVMLLEDGGFEHLPSSSMIDIIEGFKIHGKIDTSKPTMLPSHEAPSEKPSPTNNRVFVVVFVTCVAVVCLVTAVTVKVLLRRRKKCRRRMRKSFVRHQVDISTISNDTLHLGIIGAKVTADMFVYDNPTLHDFGYNLHSGPLDLSALQQIVGDKAAMEDEFLMLPSKLAQLSDIPPGAEDKNRYANVIPYAETRVPLSFIEEEENSDYINANYIEGYQTERPCYIATQAPLEETKNDFWRMVWEQGTHVIIMLTGLEEQGHVKCSEYWPSSDSGSSVLIYGNYEVILEKVEVRPDWIMSELSITDITTAEHRVLRHFWLTAWPVNDSPHIPTVIHFLLTLRTYLDETTAPSIVHCSSGTGRTGTLLAIELCMQSYDDVGTVDIACVVRRLRQQRCGMVRTKQQFNYVYTAMYEYAKMVEEAKKVTAENTSR